MPLSSAVQMYSAAMLPHDSGSAVCCTNPSKGGGGEVGPQGGGGGAGRGVGRPSRFIKQDKDLGQKMGCFHPHYTV